VFDWRRQCGPDLTFYEQLSSALSASATSNFLIGRDDDPAERFNLTLCDRVLRQGQGLQPVLIVDEAGAQLPSDLVGSPSKYFSCRAPCHNCRYRWLHAPATNCIGTKRSPVSGDLFVFWAAANIEARFHALSSIRN